MNSAFIGYEEFCRSRKVDNTLLNRQNSSYPMKAEFNNNCFFTHSKYFQVYKQAKTCYSTYCSKISWLSMFETRDSILASRSSNASSFEMRGSRHLEFRGSRIQIQEARFSERTMLYSHVAVQIFPLSISACGAVFCNCLNRRGSPNFQ